MYKRFTISIHIYDWEEENNLIYINIYNNTDIHMQHTNTHIATSKWHNAEKMM